MNLTPDTKVLVQGITEQQGSIYTARMKAYGTNVVAGVSSGQGGQQLDDVPVFDLVEQALSEVGSIDTSIIFVPPYCALDAGLESISAGIRRIILVSRGVPPLDMVQLVRKAEATETLILGPATPGIIVPGKILLGSHEAKFYTPGSVALITRTDTLTYEVAWELTQAGLGQSIAVSLGSEPVIGSSLIQWLQILEADKSTKAIVLVDQTGVGIEETAADYIAQAIDKPVIAYVASCNAPPEKHPAHADAIALWRKEAMNSSGLESSSAELSPAKAQITAFKKANISVASRPSQIPDLVKKALKK